MSLFGLTNGPVLEESHAQRQFLESLHVLFSECLFLQVAFLQLHDLLLFLLLLLLHLLLDLLLHIRVDLVHRPLQVFRLRYLLELLDVLLVRGRHIHYQAHVQQLLGLRLQIILVLSF